MSFLSRLVGRILRQECAFCGRRPGELLSKTPLSSGGSPAPDWLRRDPETNLRFCGQSCRVHYGVLDGIPPRHAIQPRTRKEEQAAAKAEEDWPSLQEDEDWVALPDEAVDRDPSTESIIARILAAIALVIAFADLPYGYYQILRIWTCGVAAWSAFEAVQANRQGWAWFLGFTAVLFNPIVPIHLQREIWQVVDVGVALGLLASLRYMVPKRDVPSTEPGVAGWKG